MATVRIKVPLNTEIKNIKIKCEGDVNVKIEPDLEFPCFIIDETCENTYYFIATGIENDEYNGIGFLTKEYNGCIDYSGFELTEGACDDIKDCKLMTDMEKAFYLKEISQQGYIWDNEKLIKLKDGDFVTLYKGDHIIGFKNIYDDSKVKAHFFFNKNNDDTISFEQDYACDTYDFESLTSESDIKLVKEALNKKNKQWDDENKKIIDKFIPKDGDFVVGKLMNATLISIFEKTWDFDSDKTNVYAADYISDNRMEFDTWISSDWIQRLATDSEKEIFLNKLKEKGKQWNPDKKCIEDIIWKPRIGQKYWTIDVTGSNGVYKYEYQSDTIDERILANNLYFQTEEEAIEAFKAIVQLFK